MMLVMKLSAFFLLLEFMSLGLAEEPVRKSRSDDDTLEAQVAHLAQEVTTLRAELAATNNRITASAGSTYVRWGRTQCPSNAQLVYSGRAGGSYRENTGGSPNRLCLPMNPQYDSAPAPAYYGRLYGAEYLQIQSHHSLLVPCAVCHVPHSSVLMVPATMTCPDGWTRQYSGHLASEDHNHASIAEYVCLDGQPEDVPGTVPGPANYFYHTVGVCGVLPCPPYINNKPITCVVCSN